MPTSARATLQYTAHPGSVSGGPPRGTTIKSGLTISGLGVVSGYGWGVDAFRTGLYSGYSAIRQVAGFGEYFPDDNAWVAMIEDGGDPADGTTRFPKATRAAAREAVTNAMERGWRPSGEVGIIHGITLSDVEIWRDFHYRRGHNTSPRAFLGLMPSTVVSGIAKEFSFHGPSLITSAMCATGPSALLLAKTLISAGTVTDVLLVVTDMGITPPGVKAFASLGVLRAEAADACRPFQEGSKGFVCGEASVAMIVSGNPDGGYARVIGGAQTNDAYHAVSIDPSLAQVKRCFAEALRNAGVDSEDITYLNAHGTGTKQCDQAEALLFDEMFPNARGLVALKPLVGHCQGASGAIETAAICLAYETGVVAAPFTVSSGHPRLLNGPEPRKHGLFAKSSLGMGGNNVVIVLDEPLR
jgi:3-oxoacyl-[acyl-carrier-protein] synthase II